MPPSHEEKADIRVVKDSMVNMSDAQTANTQAQTEVAKQISGLLVEMREREVRNEYLTIEVKQNSAKQEGFESYARPILVKAKAKQEFRQKITDSMGTNIGKLILAIFAAGALFLLGVDPTQWKI